MYLVRSPYILRSLYQKAIWNIRNNDKKIFLTFDDGPVPEITPWVLDVLKEKDITATFFCVGENIQKHPEIFDQIKTCGHGIGNHTFNHLKGWNVHTFEYLKNVEKCNTLTQSGLFRPPYGRIKQSQYKALLKKYKIIMWDVLSGDYDKNTTPENCLDNVIEYTRSGSIIVFHDSIKAKECLYYALPKFIDFAKEQGYSFEKLE